MVNKTFEKFSATLSDINELKALIKELNDRTAEYDAGRPTISDKEWDDKYFHLQELEKKTNIIYPDSPTSSIPYSVVNGLKKVTHSHKMLSLAKTKSLEDIRQFGGAENLIAMLKLDGLTCSLTYENGVLTKAETRGNGEIGEDVYHNALVISSIPKQVPIKDKTLIIDGEIICTYDDYENFSLEYKNPRNFAAGSIRLLDSKECRKRKLTFVAWDAISGLEEYTALSDKLLYLKFLGFNTVPNNKFTITDKVVSGDSLTTVVHGLQKIAEKIKYPIDGIVFKIDDCEKYNALGATAHHFRGGIAYKFYDEEYDTTLLNIEWSMGRTGVLTPVAIFEPIEIDGTTVERASLHNIDVMYDTLGGDAYVGETLFVTKVNQIIPQIIRVDRKNSSKDKIISIPTVCPCCNQEVKIIAACNTRELVCENHACPGKLCNIIDHFVSKKGLDIKGLSEKTIDWLIAKDWLKDISDIFTLYQHKSEWVKEEGFGEKSVSNILNAIEERKKNCSLSAFISALGIPLIGATYAKQLAAAYSTWENFISAIDNNVDFSALDGFGDAMNTALHNYNYILAKKIAEQLTFISSSVETNNNCKDLVFVITGKITHWKNRDELKSVIEAAGGKVTGSVTKNTSYLINNDINSNTSKNETAKKLGVPIITEDEFRSTFLKL